jgi:hypothetical protein
MASNDIAPGFVKLHYQSAFAEHIATIPCDPVYDAGTLSWLLKRKDGGASILDSTAVGALVAVLKALVSGATTFTYFELWTKVAGAAPIFVDTAPLNVVGTNGNIVLSASQMLFSIRDNIGGHGRIEVMDQSYPVNSKYQGTAYGDATKLAVVNYLIGNSSWILTRKGGYPYSIPKILTKTNDVLRRKYGIVV